MINESIFREVSSLVNFKRIKIKYLLLPSLQPITKEIGGKVGGDKTSSLVPNSLGVTESE